MSRSTGTLLRVIVSCFLWLNTGLNLLCRRYFHLPSLACRAMTFHVPTAWMRGSRSGVSGPQAPGPRLVIGYDSRSGGFWTGVHKMFLAEIPVATVHDLENELGVARKSMERWRAFQAMPCATWKGSPTKPKSALTGIVRGGRGGKHMVLFHRPQVALWLRDNGMPRGQREVTVRMMERFIAEHLDG